MSNELISGSNFIRNIIDEDNRNQKWGQRVETRFPPEPNGHLHIGHAKSICVNFGIARDYGGICHLRFDDTNPEKEEKKYVDAIIETVKWLGFSYQQGDQEHLHFASDYFEKLYQCAEILIQRGHAYVDSQKADQIRANRGSLTERGIDSPFRSRTFEENLHLFRRMRAGEFPNGQHVLRAKIDMASPNINMRDPVIYRIRHAYHHRTGNSWCIYPMYAYAHPLEDAIENITHSLCTLEFSDQRPFYDWVLERLTEAEVFLRPMPQQIEFARLKLAYSITSKRHLRQLVDEGYVDGWNDPRMPTLAGLRRRGFTPESIRLFCDRIGVSKADSWIDINILEKALRDDLDPKVPRSFAVLDPIKLIIDNYAQNSQEDCEAPVHPQHPERGIRTFPLSRELWIEREDFQVNPVKNFFRLFPGNKVRLRYAYVIECTSFDTDIDGKITAVHCQYFPNSKSGTPGADNFKVKGNIHWISTAHAVHAEVRVYDRLFTHPNPEVDEKNFLEAINANAKHVLQAFVEPGLTHVGKEDRFQFERHGYFVVDRYDSQPDKPVFNRIVSLKDSWSTKSKKDKS
ncbi:glutamine--tRNA ligase/YqeY domain fusion protein [Candidatus Pandoraea novymonadis]|uniref:Glutamine--tRNA ligase n=1 Tax=Candidatus Pandoraea novymonadis TaxID=1808959 RepID=A0ABX5FF76_9BURK|nr:glutamine--tRNA ligase/YqeY domain fusion protein [Candidatus Pandoraea novymonadis]PSB91981.1 Glutamine-tRNA ligase [Candidatus Pandoraea novymonadis]